METLEYIDTVFGSGVMHYNLLFNGCSFTEGAELEGFNKNYEYRDNNRFSHVVGELTGLTYANISKGGASNDRILRTTMEWFEEGNTCDHAIIQWTSRPRIEYFSEKILVDCNTTPNYYSIYPNMSILNRLGESILQDISNIQNNSNDQHNEDRCMYWMEKLLKDKCSFDYLKLRRQLKVCDEYYETGTYYKYRTKFPITYIRGDILSEKTDTDEDYCYTYKKVKTLKGGHPSKLGHRKIAEYIINNFDYFQ